MTRPDRDDRALAALDALIDEITVDALGDDEQFWAFRQAFENNIVVPVDGFVIGEPVSVIAFEYDGNERRGLTARCRRADGAEHVVAACDVVLPQNADAERYLAAYRKRLGLAPYPSEAVVSKRPRRHKATATDLDLTGPVELVTLSVKDTAARCRLLASDRVITLRASGLWHVVPGEIVVVTPRKQWSYAGHPYLSGEIASARLDVAALGLVPLRLEDRGVWNPDEVSLGDQFDGVLPWGHLDNRPFLRCMHGFGLCCWRLGRFEEAGRVFDRMLWLNPSDNQGVRFLIDPVQARMAWEDRPHT